MTARVLVVDDILPNVRLLEAKLTSEYFDVLTATSGPEALKIAGEEKPDIILLDVMMPEMDGFEVCRKLKAAPETSHIPVVMVTALDQQSDKVTGLEAGADDFLTKPVSDTALFARVRSLVRLKVTMDEYRNRVSTELAIGSGSKSDDIVIDPADTRILLVEEDRYLAKEMKETLSVQGHVDIDGGHEDIADIARKKDYSLIIVSLNMKQSDGLRICSSLRSFEETRQVPVLVIVEADDTNTLVRALEMGVNDYLVNPPDRMELLARTRTQLKRKQFADRLKENLHKSVKLAATDAVTGLYNRHYMTNHLETLFKAALKSGKPLSLALLDIDRFKSINDTYGHDNGDRVLQEFANRISQNTRGVDLVARYGGEEFVVVMPETRGREAGIIAERLREVIANEPFDIHGVEKPISVTVSIGLATAGKEPSVKNPEALIKKADKALYEAKSKGRNRLVSASKK